MHILVEKSVMFLDKKWCGMGDNYLENSMMEPFGFGVVPCCSSSRVGWDTTLRNVRFKQ